MSAIVFVHGAGMDNTSWQYQTSFFEGAIAVNLPGHGDSPDASHSNVGEYATWLGETVRRLGPEPVTLVGHSMGSLVVLETAARNLDIVARLVLMATAATMPVHRDLLAAATAKDPAAAAMVIKWSLPRDGGYGRPKKWVQQMSDAFVAAAESGVMGDDFRACDTYQDALAMAEKVRCPTLLLLGEHDIMTKPTAAQPLAAALTDARIVVIEGVGHMLPLEKPAEVNEALSLFLSIS
ncbi:MAG: alpha/beta hydrolase [Acidimicrobiia bacterium]|nr:alpha/beta hydrolase [Acidimicrobiia bacterium]MDX2466650.1 alpha/beta hydrolase [Acidimicrobiia bacterium]